MTIPTNNQIMLALMQQLRDSGLPYPVSWPGFNFTPPDNGVWLEIEFQPNQGIDNGLAPADGVVPQGMMTIMVMDRPGRGFNAIQQAADEVKALYPKDWRIAGLVRVRRAPWSFGLDVDGRAIGLAVSVEYSG